MTSLGDEKADSPNGRPNGSSTREDPRIPGMLLLLLFRHMKTNLFNMILLRQFINPFDNSIKLNLIKYE